MRKCVTHLYWDCVFHDITSLDTFECEPTYFRIEIGAYILSFGNNIYLRTDWGVHCTLL